MKTCSFVLVIATLTSLSGIQSLAVTVDPVADGTIRDGLNFPKDGIPDHVIDSSVVQILDVDRPVVPFEDRGIIEFDITPFLGVTQDIILYLPVFRSMEPFPFTVDVFSYIGDGSLSLSDFNDGTLFSSFSYTGEPSVRLDVTSLIDDLLLAGEWYAGFNFQYSIPSNIESNGPFLAFNSLEFGPAARLTAVPLPTPIWLSMSGLLGLLGMKYGKSRLLAIGNDDRSHDPILV